MSELNKSYRIRTKIGNELENNFVNIDENIVQEYDTFEILSVNINSQDTYRLHNSNHGIVVGRVLANNGFGIPNAKISIFIKVDGNEDGDAGIIYPYTTTVSEDRNGVRYNLLPNEKVDGCHQVVGTFPTKRYALDNDVILEVFDKYYKYTTKTNNSGDYLICGVPVGAHTLHMDLDLSDCGILSQRPRDFVYKGYTIEQFETPTKFKGGTDYGNLSQVFTQDQVVNVKPFWGNESLGESIGITRADINVNFKFEPTCVFMGSIISDNSSNGFSKKCIPTDNMGNMDELVTGEGKIEMIRKTPGGNIEELSIKGNKLIDANGVWCYQIPMNLDYMVTDEYGNMVPTDNPDKGIPTRASVRFRISMEDHEENTENFFRAKVLVPNNPQNLNEILHENYDYEFGTYTRDDSFRDLFWNNVYSVKSYIPRIQKNRNPKSERFSGIKHCQNFGPNNPMPYNNIRIRMPLMFTIVCALIKCFILLAKITNTIIAILGWVFAWLGTHFRFIYLEIPRDEDCEVAHCKSNCTKMFCDRWWNPRNWKMGKRCLFRGLNKKAKSFHLIILKDGLCPDLENWYFSPMYLNVLCPTNNNCFLEYSGTCVTTDWFHSDDGEDGGINTGCTYCEETESGTSGTEALTYNILKQTLDFALNEADDDDPTSIDDQNEDEDDDGTCLTVNTDYLISCVEMNLAQEYKVINFDFYNDWVNGTIYIPRWVRYIKRKKKKVKIRGCMDDTNIFSKSRRYIQQCAIGYDEERLGEYLTISKVEKPDLSKPSKIVKANNLHKRRGIKHQKIFGKNGGICHQNTTMKGQFVYYLKPCEWLNNTNIKVNLFATDIILLGSFNDCDLNGIPQIFTHLTSSSYVMPTNLALTNMDTNGPLYAKDGGTICNKATGVTPNSGSVITARVHAIDGSNPSGFTLEKEINFYKDTVNYSLDENDDYPGGIELDTIAMTEAAGIAWNYTGPGQGSIDKEKMYYPGGHFLGISCVNAQTNLKSCINLSRICEIGSSMSQRRDDIRRREADGTFKFTYTVPTGFISGDEIIDTDFRSMFATLNKKRLIATKRNPDTGYRFYNFDYSMPINFNGAFSEMSGGKTPYNEKVEVKEENLTLFGITIGSSRDDYDQEETANTQTRTRENFSLDYYLYRFGITYDQLNGSNFTDYQRTKFLRTKNSTSSDNFYTLPQYENSYYFYFGLKFGSTAIDEFNKQFYSECENLMIKKAPNLRLISIDKSFCDFNSKISVMTEGLSTPYQRIEIHKDGEMLYLIDGSEEFHTKLLTSEVFGLKRKDGNVVTEYFDFGKYTITIIDADDIEISKDITIGINDIKYKSRVVDFNMPIPQTGTSESPNKYNGGYLLIEDLYIEDIDIEDLDYVKFKLYDGNTNTYTSNYSDGNAVLYCRKKDNEYIVNIEIKCKGHNSHEAELERFRVRDNSSVSLKVGTKNGFNMNIIYHYDENASYEVTDIMSKMYKTWWFDDLNYNIGNNVGESDEAKLKWLLRALMYNRNKSKETFDSNVFASNGTKVLWGTPQNKTDISDTTGCTEDYYSIKPGYSLDDKFSYYSTYGVNNCDFIPVYNGGDRVLGSGTGSQLYPNCIMHYCAQAYNGTNVCGKPHGRMYKTGDGHVVVTFETNYFHEGYGCIFKPLPFGPLKFMIYDSTNSYANMESELTEYEYGIFYPTFIYPVIKRPFWVKMIYFLWTEQFLTNTGDFNKRMLGLWCDNTIYNGITYNRHLHESSEMTNTKVKDTVFSLPDSYGISEDSNTNRETKVDWYEDIQMYGGGQCEISYKIKEGVGLPEADELSKTHEFLFVTNFAEQLAYKLNENNEIEDFFGLGGETSGYTYYIGTLDKNSDGITFIENGAAGDDYLIEELNSTSTNSTFACVLRFVDNENNMYLANSEIGREVVARFYVAVDQNMISRYKVRIVFDYINVNGEQETFDDTFDLIGFDSNTANTMNTISSCAGNRKQLMKKLILKKINNVLPLKPVIDGILKRSENTYIGSTHKEWSELFASTSFKKHLKTRQYFVTESHTIPLPDENGPVKLFGVGATSFNTEDGDSLSVYVIYKDLVLSPPGFDPFANEALIWTSITQEDFDEMFAGGCGIGEKKYSFTVSSDTYTDITFDFGDTDWIYLTEKNSEASLGNNFTKSFRGIPFYLDLHIKSNTGSSRNGSFEIRTNSDTKNFEINQISYWNSPEIVIGIRLSGETSNTIQSCAEYGHIMNEDTTTPVSLSIFVQSGEWPDWAEEQIIGISIQGSGSYLYVGNYFGNVIEMPLEFNGTMYSVTTRELCRNAQVVIINDVDYNVISGNEINDYRISFDVRQVYYDAGGNTGYIDNDGN